MRQDRDKKPRPPLDKEGLERLALFYAGRYATTRAKLKSYLARKIRERGWEGEGEPPVDRLVERFTELGYVDDRAFAAAKGASLQRRGYGARRIAQALHAAGIEEADSAEAKSQAEEKAWDSALRFARRKRIGPFASEAPDRDARAKAFAAMMRAGHSTDVARQMLDLRAGEVPNPDEM